MTDEIRQAVNERLAQQGMSRADLARAMNRTPQEITRALNGGKRGGEVPKLWQDLLDVLGFEIVVREKTPSSSG